MERMFDMLDNGGPDVDGWSQAADNRKRGVEKARGEVEEGAGDGA
jgi:hypothetical protein